MIHDGTYFNNGSNCYQLHLVMTLSCHRSPAAPRRGEFARCANSVKSRMLPGVGGPVLLLPLPPNPATALALAAPSAAVLSPRSAASCPSSMATRSSSALFATNSLRHRWHRASASPSPSLPAADAAPGVAKACWRSSCVHPHVTKGPSVEGGDNLNLHTKSHSPSLAP